MYIHIGEDILVKTKDIIAILDKNSVNASDQFQEYLQSNHKNIENLAKNSYKSIVITSEKVYLSPLASTTLKKRSNKLYVMDH